MLKCLIVRQFLLGRDQVRNGASLCDEESSRGGSYRAAWSGTVACLRSPLIFMDAQSRHIKKDSVVKTASEMQQLSEPSRKGKKHLVFKLCIMTAYHPPHILLSVTQDSIIYWVSQKVCSSLFCSILQKNLKKFWANPMFSSVYLLIPHS